MSILNKLTIKHLTMNKKRTIVSIIGVLLSTALMVGMGLLLSTFRDFLIRDIISYNGSHHVKITNLPYEKLKNIENNITIKTIAYDKGIGFAYFKESKNSYKPYFYVVNGNDAYLETLILKEGRLPKNSNEVVISEQILPNHNYKIGEKLNLELGYRYRFFDDYIIKNNEEDFYMESDETPGETLKIEFNKEYTIVGIVEHSYHEPYSASGYQIYTKAENISGDELLSAYITYKKVSKVYDKTDTLIKNLGIQDNNKDSVKYNSALLAMYGTSKYDNVNKVMVRIIVIILSLISIGCTIVIYNSFAISVMERKKQFGLFSSIGATKRQLRKTVFYEAFIVGLIGILLGLLSGFLGIWIVLKIVNYLLIFPNAFAIELNLVVYPLFIIIPIIFMILVIIFSAFLPAKRASKITPIEAIRLNDDIKIKSKKVKTNKLVRKIIGIEGDIALKNMKRNKRKYRITMVSLFISVVLFISFSTLLTYVTVSSTTFFNDVDFDIYLEADDEDKNLLNRTINDIINTSEVEKSVILRQDGFLTNSITDDDYHKDYLPIFEKAGYEKDTFWANIKLITVITMDNKSYRAYLKELGLKEEQPILINQFAAVDYSEGRIKVIQGKLLKSRDNWQINTCDNSKVRDYKIVENALKEVECYHTIKNIYETTKLPFGFSYLIESAQPIIIIPNGYINEIVDYYDNDEYREPSSIVLIKASKYTELDKKINAYIDEYKLDTLYYANIQEQTKMSRNIILIIKILFYGFISLVTLIGVTSVFNTINTSIALRRREFAVLRSMGLTPKGFNRLLQFETLIVGLKALFYALPVSLGIIYLINKSASDMVTFSDMMIPWKSIMFAVIGVFVIISITMWYATRRIKKENILDAIREENI